MDRKYEKEKSSRRAREERDSGKDHYRDLDRYSERERDRDRDSSKDHHRDIDRHRDRDNKNRSREDRSRRSEERHHSDKHGEEKHSSKDEDDSKDRVSVSRHSKDNKHRDDDDWYRSRGSEDYERKRERSHEQRNGREGSKDLVSREESVERRSYLSSPHKRKERGESEDRLDRSDKRSRVSDGTKEERKENRRIEDKVLEDSKDVNEIANKEKKEGMSFEDGIKEEVMKDTKGSTRGERRERRKFGDRTKEYDAKVAQEEKLTVSDEKSEEKQLKDAQLENDQRTVTSNGSSSIANSAAMDRLNVSSKPVPEASSARSHPLPTKVSSISTTNENKGVSITRSHEVPGKSSTDGAITSVASKSGSLSLDALAKAKKALQMQKELSEKLKKIPLLNKGPIASSSTEMLHETVPPITSSSQALSSTSMFPAASVKPPGNSMAAPAGLTTVPNFEAVKRAQELAAKMGFHHDPEFAPLINMFPGQQIATSVAVPQKPPKAPVLRLDALGREIDEHGNVINMPKLTNLSTLKVNINKQKKEAFQILKPELDVDPDSNPHFDARMGINKTKLLRPKRMSFQFVEEGTWSKQAEIIKFKSQFGEAQAKELKTKQAQLAKAKAELDINPNLIEVSERVIIKEKPKDPIPETEWWDVPLLPSGTYGDINKDNITEDKVKLEKITIYVEHPLPIEPPAEPAPPPPQPLKLTKKEQKKLRTQRRLSKEKDRQEMIRQGLLEPPKPKIKMSNLMKVLGSEATQDPTRLEMEIRSAAAEREQAHADRNIARKLTPAERREKKERKLFEDPNTIETIVSVYRINDLSDPKTRFKVDVNAQENRLTGCAVISDGISVVVVEGGGKPIKRYGKLMLGRINWATAVVNGEDDDENEDKPVNKCSLVWQGSVAKPGFNRFFVHQCRTEAAARKIFSDAGVGHYWDLAVNFSDDQM